VFPPSWWLWLLVCAYQERKKVKNFIDIVVRNYLANIKEREFIHGAFKLVQDEQVTSSLKHRFATPGTYFT